jgi:hypothetical protein
MESHILEAVEEKKGLGVIVDKTLTFSVQCLKAVNSANAAVVHFLG